MGRLIVAATLYDGHGNRFGLSRDVVRFERSHLVGFEPVVQGDKHLGTLYLEVDLGALYQWPRLYAVITRLVTSRITRSIGEHQDLPSIRRGAHGIPSHGVAEKLQHFDPRY